MFKKHQDRFLNYSWDAAIDAISIKFVSLKSKYEEHLM